MRDGTGVTPVRRARVSLIPSTGAPLIIDSDTNGRYRFDARAGSYLLAVAKPGFLVADAGTTVGASGRIPVQISGTTTTRDVIMAPAASIEGRVIDSVGGPVVDVLVEARQIRGDGSRAPAVASARTDDRGRYRLHTVPPGEYTMEATVPAQAGPGPAALAARSGGSRLYYPGVTRVDDAQRVTVGAGSLTTGIDIGGASQPGPSPAQMASRAGVITNAAPASLSGTGKIAGRVTRADNARPLPAATVTLAWFEGGRLTRRGSATDTEGRFEIAGLGPGSYQVTVTADGFLDREFGWTRAAPFGRRIDLARGESFDQANVAMPAPGAIEGRVLDEFGDAVADVLVQLATVQFIAGSGRLVPVGGRVSPRPSDDTGAFRIFNLRPDDYYVMALSGPFAPDSDLGGFALTLYPGTRTATDARPMPVNAGGDTLGVVFSLVPGLVSNVTGAVVDTAGDPVENATVLLRPMSGGDVRVLTRPAQARTNAAGQFSFRNVPEGSYAMQASGGLVDTFGFTTIDVSGPETRSVGIEVRPCAFLRGRATFEGNAPRPALRDVRINWNTAELQSAPYEVLARQTTWRADGTFEVPCVYGFSIVSAAIASSPWTVSRITLAGRDVTDALVDFRRGDVEGVEITFTDRAASIAGTVMDGVRPAADYAVVIFAADRLKWQYPTRFVMVGRPNQQGGFRVTGVPAGSYLAVALPQVDNTGWQDPQFLETLVSVATPFNVENGQSRALALKLVR